MTTTLDLIHQELDESLKRQLYLIESDATIALWRLDDMVDDFNRAQLRKPRTIAQIEQRRAWQSLFSGYANMYLRESEALRRLLRSEPSSDGLVTFPVVQSRTRTYDEQKALYDRWGARKNPDGIAFPGPPSHHVGGLAIDLGDPLSAPLYFDNAGRHVSDFAEPWHFEYARSESDDRTWFEKLRDRFVSWNLKRHMRKAGML